MRTAALLALLFALRLAVASVRNFKRGHGRRGHMIDNQQIHIIQMITLLVVARLAAEPRGQDRRGRPGD
jgi:hypothetical protein